MTKLLVNNQEFGRTVEILLKNYEDQLFDTNQQVVYEAAGKNSFWLRHTKEFIKFFSDENQQMKVINLLVPRIRDRHNRLSIVPLKRLQEYRMQQADCFSFSPLNPTGF